MSRNARDLYIGLISGTSIDGIDAGLYKITGSPESEHAELLAHHAHPYPATIHDEILALSSPGNNEIDRMGDLDHQLGHLFADAANTLLLSAEVSADEIAAIGSHGQTIRHRPTSSTPFTLQIADANIIAHATGIPTVADLRRHDMAAGGQGAPLATAFHRAIFHSAQVKRAVINIGGIANISVLENDASATLGYDTGPGNVLMDGWIKTHLGKDFDEGGSWAQSGKIDSALLNSLLNHPYLREAPPKSTGREDFNADYLNTLLTAYGTITAEDVQATLCEFTAMSIAQAVSQHQCSEVYICGGGARNTFLLSRLATHLSPVSVETTQALGVHADWVEAGLCAWLAKRRLQGLAGNLPSVTGASSEVVLGGLYLP